MSAVSERTQAILARARADGDVLSDDDLATALLLQLCRELYLSVILIRMGAEGRISPERTAAYSRELDGLLDDMSVAHLLGFPPEESL